MNGKKSRTPGIVKGEDAGMVLIIEGNHDHVK
jgi:hypothetical protein